MTFINRKEITHKELKEWLSTHKEDNLPLFKWIDEINDAERLKTFKRWLNNGYKEKTIKMMMNLKTFEYDLLYKLATKNTNVLNT